MNLLWHDDIRKPPDSDWDWARTNDEAKKLLLSKKYDAASLDHDLGLHDEDPNRPDAYRVYSKNRRLRDNGEQLAKWMAENPEVIPSLVRIHSYNPVGARRMGKILNPFTQVVIQPFDPRERKPDA